MNDRKHVDRGHPDAFKEVLWDLVMLLYLLTGLGLAPLVVGEVLVALGWVESMNEQTMPSWMYGYVVLTMFTAALALMIAWLPALLICVLFWNRWRAVIPALCVIVFAVNLFFAPDDQWSSAMLSIAAISYVLVASGVGIEWFIRRKFAATRADHEQRGS